MVEKSDEFNERMLNRQNFSYQKFALRKFRYCIFYGVTVISVSPGIVFPVHISLGMRVSPHIYH